MNDNADHAGGFSDDMSEYLQIFLDETDEQLDDLVEMLLALEHDSTSHDHLNEAFRLIHSIKGSAGMMGFDNITSLTHHLENRFERFRAGQARLDETTMNLVLRSIDFLRQCNARLRDGDSLPSSSDLLDELKRIEKQSEQDVRASHAPEPASSDNADLQTPPDETAAVAEEPAGDGDDQQPLSAPTTPASTESLPDSDTSERPKRQVRLTIRFRPGLQLPDLKAQLIVARLAGLGDIRSTHPDVDELVESDHLEAFEVVLESAAESEAIRGVADVDGVESIACVDAETSLLDLMASPGRQPGSAAPDAGPPAAEDREPTEDVAGSPEHGAAPEPEAAEPQAADDLSQRTLAEPTGGGGKVAETMRIDIDRLDNLLNLAGELVVNRARFVQISGQINPALRKATMLNRIRDFSDGLRKTIESLERADGGDDDDRSAQIQQLQAGLEMMDEQFAIWENGRQCITEMTEAIDQLSRVSHSLQRGVLDTRMVPVGPLFNRFKRVVRDLSKERGKNIHLQIRGEQTELDKRMIDELGDPLVHLVRNSIDHGMEPPPVRAQRGKPETGTVCLEASHRGNSVFIRVHDDGGGVDAEKIRAKVIEKGILNAAAARELSDEQALEYIWHPGFSTAAKVTDISGRGVGMDVVKTRIDQLNGTIEVASTPGLETSFTIRLPLTLAIINSLLVRLRGVLFSVPIDDVREIVSVRDSDIIRVHGKRTIEVRNEYLPLVAIDDVFQWHGIDYDNQAAATTERPSPHQVDVVLLQAGGKTLGMRVDELLGSQDIVIKSLSDNFMHIRGLSGASILGDGSVCLMLDVGSVIDMALRTPRIDEDEDQGN